MIQAERKAREEAERKAQQEIAAQDWRRRRKPAKKPSARPRSRARRAKTPSARRARLASGGQRRLGSGAPGARRGGKHCAQGRRSGRAGARDGRIGAQGARRGRGPRQDGDCGARHAGTAAARQCGRRHHRRGCRPRSRRANRPRWRPRRATGRKPPRAPRRRPRSAGSARGKRRPRERQDRPPSSARPTGRRRSASAWSRCSSSPSACCTSCRSTTTSAARSQLMSERLGVPVTISNLRYALLPTPQLTLERVGIGKLQEIKIETLVVSAWPMTLLGDTQNIRQRRGQQRRQRGEDALALLPGWFKPHAGRAHRAPRPAEVGQSSRRRTSTSRPSAVTSRSIRTARCSGQLLGDGKVRVELTPKDKALRVGAGSDATGGRRSGPPWNSTISRWKP